ncbi:MAG TPA: molybdate ABC transporter substrate-binding protein [Calditrichia bacterium]|nr:molybdate ABC transporter substrate-binding protein [Calditrichia bacterium]
MAGAKPHTPFWGIAFLAILTLVLPHCDKAPSPLRVYAAASLSGVLPQFIDAFRTGNRQVRIETVYGASSVLARQIEAGAPADVFLSADQDWMAFLDSLALIRPLSRREICRNRLAVVCAPGNPLNIRETGDLLRAGEGQIALGDWHHVPLGKYAHQALQRAGLWQQLLPRFVPAVNARAAYTYIWQGHLPVGIVYASDFSPDRTHLTGFPLADSLQPHISYPGALLRQTRHPEAEAFLTFLSEPDRDSLWVENGFLPAGPPHD